jgi:hypothetical protein
MEKIVIKVSVDAKTALAAGCTQAGTGEYPVTRALIDACTPAQALQLREVADVPGTVSVYGQTLKLGGAPSDETVIAALQVLIDAAAAEEAERQGKIEEEKDSYRELIRRAESGELYPAAFPPRENTAGVTRLGAPNYSSNDLEARALWQRYLELDRREREESIRVENDRLAAEGIDAHLTGEGAELKPSPAVFELRHEANRLLGHGITRDARDRLAPFVAEVERAIADRLTQAQEAQAAALREVVAQHAPDLLERHEAGVLPADELRDELRDALLVPFVQFRGYERLTRADVVAAAAAADEGIDEHCVGSPEYEVRDVEDGGYTCTEAQWAQIKRIRLIATHHGCTATVREHTGTTREMGDYVRRLGVRVCREYVPGKRVCRELSVD